MKKLVILFFVCALITGVSAQASTLHFARRHPILSGAAAVVGVALLLSHHRIKAKTENEGLEGYGDGDNSEVSSSPTIIEKSNSVKLRKALNEERSSAGLPPDPDKCDAHHIVPSEDSRSSIKEYTETARDAIAGCVAADSAENGIFLPRDRNGAECDGPYHRAIHNENYYRPLSARLTAAKDSAGCDGVKAELRLIKEGLEKGVMP